MREHVAVQLASEAVKLKADELDLLIRSKKVTRTDHSNYINQMHVAQDAVMFSWQSDEAFG